MHHILLYRRRPWSGLVGTYLPFLVQDVHCRGRHFELYPVPTFESVDFEIRIKIWTVNGKWRVQVANSRVTKGSSRITFVTPVLTTRYALFIHVSSNM